MRICIHTEISAALESVHEKFNEDLFIALAPKFPRITLTRFDGSKTGDIVALELNFLFFKQAWVSQITEEETTVDSWYFIDKGIDIPFFLKEWQHKHIVKRTKKGSVIIDDIQFTSGIKIVDFFLYPVFKLQFAARSPIYKRYF